MSCYYDVLCVTCYVRHPHDGSRSFELLRALLCMRDELAAFAPAAATLELDVTHDALGRVDLAWFAVHKGHELVVEDECGRRLEDGAWKG